jgi:hypothetical protein
LYRINRSTVVAGLDARRGFVVGAGQGFPIMDERMFTQIGTWQDFDPGWLVQLALAQLPAHPQIARALQECTRCRPESQGYATFVDSGRPNKADGPWQFAMNVSLHDPTHGEIVLDVLTNGRIGGLEFMERPEV